MCLNMLIDHISMSHLSNTWMFSPLSNTPLML